MKPIGFEESNCMLGGEIPANKAEGMILTRWQGCWRERLKFLFFGKLWVMAHGETIPPLLVTSDLEFKIANPPPSEIL